MSFSFLSSRNGREKIGFVGVGRSNIGVYRYLFERGFRNFVFRSQNPVALPKDVHASLLCGGGYLSDIDEDVLFLSPSVKEDKKEIAAAKARGILISSDCDLFFREVAGEVFAVTGSDGKSTTVSMLSRLLENGDFPVRLGGNIGVPLCPYLLDNEKTAKYTVELSSFQLSNLTPRTKRAVITTLSENHLDFHGSFSAYSEAKSHIYTYAEEPVLNADSPLCRSSLSSKPFAVFSLEKSRKEHKSIGADVTVFRAGEDVFLNEKKIFRINDMKVPGLYNVGNLMAAVALAYGYFDLSFAATLAKTFSGIPHRAQTVGVVDGVTYVDSSIDSSPARTIATLGTFAQKTIVILGGRGKKVPFDSLVPVLASKAKGVILTGETATEIGTLLSKSDAFSQCGAFIEYADTMKEAVKIAASFALPGDVVLLSPAATSFDAFRNFEERGEAFRKEVNKLT